MNFRALENQSGSWKSPGIVLEICFRKRVRTLMNLSHAIPDDIKHFQLTEPEHYFDYTNWRLEICTWQLKFSS